MKNSAGIRRIRGISQTLGTLLKMVWHVDKTYFSILFFSAISQAAAIILTIWIPRVLIDGYGRGWGAGDFILAVTVLLTGRWILLQLYQLAHRHDLIHQQRLQQKFPAVFAEKVMNLDYANLEDPKILDLKERALFPITSFGALQILFDALLRLMTGTATIIGVTVILLGFSPAFTLLVLGLSVASMLLNRRFMETFKEITEQLIPINRRYGYYAGVTTSPDFQKEFRLVGMNDIMSRKIGAYTGEMRSWLDRIYISQANTRSAQAVVTALTRFLTYSFVAIRIFSDLLGPRMSLGSFAVIVGATESFASSFAAITDSVLNVIQSTGFLEPFCQFLELKETRSRTSSQKPDPLKTLAFENVSFHYPGSDRLILDDVSFEIRKGEKISIVGLNNAGKSTIVKLIARFFEPDSGRILWNGNDIRNLDYEAYMRALSAVFQDFQLFPFSIGENIDPARLDPEIAEDPSGILKVLESAGIMEKIETLPQGIAAKLDKSLYDDATDFSGGQKQKLAIARSLYRNSDLIIMDEPTAALDPLAEAEIFEHFHELSMGRTAIFISHRMSSSTFSDKILLLQDGKVAAFDSHENLMKGHSLYRELFETQARNYEMATSA